MIGVDNVKIKAIICIMSFYYMRYLNFSILLTLSISCVGSKDSWQGVFFPSGCLTCEEEYVYSPVFKTYNECKDWAYTKNNNLENTKISCGRNCLQDGAVNMSKCDLVVRSWYIDMLPDSPTFSNYKE